nr:glycerophosphodiester phosphodiesterase family protein [Phytoactinopolyspora mesophila]
MAQLTVSALAVMPLASALLVTAPATSDVPAAAGPDEPRVVLSEDFSGGEIPDGWNAVEGAWSVEDGRLVGASESSSQQSRITFGPNLRNYRVEVTVRFDEVVNSARWAAVALDIAADGSTPWWIATMRSGTSAHNGLEFAQRTASNSWNVTDTAPAPYDAGTGNDVRVAIEVRGSRATWIFDDEVVVSTAALHRSDEGVLGLIANGATVSFDDVLVVEIDDDPITRPIGPDSVPAVIAHRGYSGVAPENTLAAVEAGMRTGAEYIEIDVHSSTDGVPIVLHDSTLDRTTDGTGALRDVTADYVSGLDAGSWFSAAFAGQPVPTLADVLDLMKGRAPELLLEIKGPETYDEMVTTIDVIRERDQLDQVILQSFDEQVLRDAREIEPDLRLALLRSTIDSDPAAVARDFDVVSYNPSWARLQDRPEAIAELHDAGIAVMPYTVNDPDQWEILRDLGVDGVITDHPGRLVGWNARHVQTVPEEPTVQIVSPADGAVLRRGDVIVPAVVTERAHDIQITFDGEPVEQGSVIDADSLELGEHTLFAVVTGVAGEAEASAVVTVEASAEGLVRLATGPEVPKHIRDQLLAAIDQQDWSRTARLAEQAVNRGDLGAHPGELIAADAHALR